MVRAAVPAFFVDLIVELPLDSATLVRVWPAAAPAVLLPAKAKVPPLRVRVAAVGNRFARLVLPLSTVTVPPGLTIRAVVPVFVKLPLPLKIRPPPFTVRVRLLVKLMGVVRVRVPVA